MTTCLKKGLMLIVVAMAASVLAMSSPASAASWGVIGSEHTLHSPNTSFTSTGAVGAVTSTCSSVSLTTNVASAAVLTVTSVSFVGCTATGPVIGHCTLTSTATRLPWTAAAVSTANIQIHGAHIDSRVENVPGSLACAGSLLGLGITITGTLTAGQWTGNGANQHEVIFSNAEGLVTHSALGNNTPVTVSGTYRDTQQTLTVN